MDNQPEQPQTPPPLKDYKPPFWFDKRVKLIIQTLSYIIFFALLFWGYKAFIAGDKEELVACTLEAKLCPDGSSVGRTGPNCEFAPCPPTPTQRPLLPPSSSYMKEYKTRYYNPEDFIDELFSDVDYQAFIGADESQLQEISCSEYYDYGFESKKDEAYMTIETSEGRQLVDAQVVSLLQTVAKNYPTEKHIAGFLACTPRQEGPTVILYSVGPCRGGGCGTGDDYIGLVENGIAREIQSLDATTAYFGCQQPLHLTRNGDFYFQCGGGDGPGGSRSIHKLSLNELVVSDVLNCVYGIDENGESFRRCE